MLCSIAVSVNNDNDHDVIHHANRNLACFAIIKAIVDARDAKTIEDLCSVNKVDTMLLDVLLSLVVIPTELHKSSLCNESDL
ncbi:hypothetical protein [Roseibium alexandrii]|uniref:Uncharacterized protein n=1 Tax=Roseibium alexandrii TaxID=388408 RepID=A0A0M7AM37_9HYPH|nr:hypothetical protein [Roseibium alexandrii]CTQ75502.1 hypothetical protein LAX5112_04264 [Roseibium alexandrii]